MSKKVSVIMASFLGDYPNSAKNREKKFVRAVNSFKNQTYENKELIIVADGCPKTEELYNTHFINDENIKFLKIPKQQLYSGLMRNVAFEIADGEIISYLDSDDVIGKTHLETIMAQFDTDKHDWVFYDDLLVLENFKKLQTRKVETRYGSIGTSAITHKKIDNISWTTGYGHDFVFVLKLASLGLRFTKLNKSPQYMVCHFSGNDW